MRLTETLRAAFVRAVMADVPRVDYETMTADEARRMSIANMPKWLQDACTKHKELLGYLRTTSDGASGASFFLAGPRTDENKATLVRLVEQKSQQRAARYELEKKLEKVVRGCNTTKQLADALPEFAKYLPKENAVDRSVPTVANVVADFMQAGWPGEKK